MSIKNIQKTTVYCCQCRKEIVVSELIVPDGSNFLKYNPIHDGWERFIIDGSTYYLCPRHTLDIHVVVDNKPFNKRIHEDAQKDFYE